MIRLVKLDELDRTFGDVSLRLESSPLSQRDDSRGKIANRCTFVIRVSLIGHVSSLMDGQT